MTRGNTSSNVVFNPTIFEGNVKTLAKHMHLIFSGYVHENFMVDRLIQVLLTK